MDRLESSPADAREIAHRALMADLDRQLQEQISLLSAQISVAESEAAALDAEILELADKPPQPFRRISLAQLERSMVEVKVVLLRAFHASLVS